MADLPDDMQGAPAERSAPAADIAGFWQRIVALLIDMAVLAGVGVAIGAVAYREVVALGEEGRLIGAAVTLVYFGFFNSAWGGGATPGKRIMGLRVIQRDGSTVGLSRALLRTIIFWTPYFLNGVVFPSVHIAGSSTNSAIDMALGLVLVLIVFGGSGSILYLYVFNRGTRQSLHDLVAGTFVVRAASVRAPVRAHAWKGHLAVAALVCVLGAAIPATFLFYLTRTLPGSLLNNERAVQAAVLAYPGADTAQVQTNSFYASSFNGPPVARTMLAVIVHMRSVPVSMETVQDDLAGIVLRTAPSNLDEQNLRIDVTYGYDLGIFRWTTGTSFAATPAEWAAKLRARHTGDSA